MNARLHATHADSATKPTTPPRTFYRARRRPAADAGGGLPHPLKAGLEHLSGFSLAGVKVHYNSTAPAFL